jgi:hypothetical protein
MTIRKPRAEAPMLGNASANVLLSWRLAGGACSGGPCSWAACSGGAGRACAPLLTPLRTTCAPVLTPLMATRAPILATLHPGCLGLSI